MGHTSSPGLLAIQALDGDIPILSGLTGLSSGPVLLGRQLTPGRSCPQVPVLALQQLAPAYLYLPVPAWQQRGPALGPSMCHWKLRVVGCTRSMPDTQVR
jgi:hypothetical protein